MLVYHAVSQNENVNRDHTSVHWVKDSRRPDRRTPMKTLVKKSYKFVEEIWMRYTDLNKSDIRSNPLMPSSVYANYNYI